MQLKYRAEIKCDWKSDDGRMWCIYGTVFAVDIESMTPDQFGEAAARSFREDGWLFGEGIKCLCPQHSGYRPTLPAAPVLL